MTKGPSKILYAAGGWFLGNIVGALVAGVVLIGVGLIAAPPTALAIELAVGITAFAGSVIGAVKGWSAASRAQAQYATLEQAAIQRPSRGQEMDMSPQRAAEESISQGSGKNWAASVNEERAAQAMAATQR